MDIAELLAFSVKHNASDLHLSAGLPPMIRVDGDIRRINVPVLDHKSVHELVYDIMNDKQRKDYEEFFEVDFSFEIPGWHGSVSMRSTRTAAPPRCFVRFRRRSSVWRSSTARRYSRTSATTRGPGAGDRPDRFGQVDDAGRDDGLQERYRVRPHPDHRGSDRIRSPEQEVPDQPARGASRYARICRGAAFGIARRPDIILVGELRDLETIRLAMTAAETGHLVFGTCIPARQPRRSTVIVDVFPAGEKAMVRSMLSESLRAVISQTLLKRTGGGRVACHEIMIGTPAIRNLIREDKVAQMYWRSRPGRRTACRPSIRPCRTCCARV